MKTQQLFVFQWLYLTKNRRAYFLKSIIHIYIPFNVPHWAFKMAFVWNCMRKIIKLAPDFAIWLQRFNSCKGKCILTLSWKHRTLNAQKHNWADGVTMWMLFTSVPISDRALFRLLSRGPGLVVTKHWLRGFIKIVVLCLKTIPAYKKGYCGSKIKGKNNIF